MRRMAKETVVAEEELTMAEEEKSKRTKEGVVEAA